MPGEPLCDFNLPINGKMATPPAACLRAARVPESHEDYMMDHLADTYNQVQSLGVEKLR